MAKYKYYGVHFIGYDVDLIFDKWSEVLKACDGRLNIRKGFNSLDDAKEWFASISKADEEHARKVALGKDYVVTTVKSTDRYGNTSITRLERYE